MARALFCEADVSAAPPIPPAKRPYRRTTRADRMRRERRWQLAASGKRTMCDACLHGNHSFVHHGDCCCICTEGKV